MTQRPSNRQYRQEGDWWVKRDPHTHVVIDKRRTAQPPSPHGKHIEHHANFMTGHVAPKSVQEEA